MSTDQTTTTDPLDAEERALLNAAADLLYLPDDPRAKPWPDVFTLGRMRSRLRGLADDPTGDDATTGQP